MAGLGLQIKVEGQGQMLKMCLDIIVCCSLPCSEVKVKGQSQAQRLGSKCNCLERSS